MPFYQMLCITTHVNEYRHIKELVRQTATHVLNAGGVVRDIKSMGTRTLPQRMSRHKTMHSLGDYWTLHFDTAPRTLRSLNAIMRRDPRVIRWTVLKMADKVEDVAMKGQEASLHSGSSVHDLTD